MTDADRDLRDRLDTIGRHARKIERLDKRREAARVERNELIRSTFERYGARHGDDRGAAPTALTSDLARAAGTRHSYIRRIIRGER